MPNVQPPVTASHRLATLVFLMAGTMLFAGLVGGYLVLRYASRSWPSPGMPPLPTGLAGFNTVVIALSSLALRRAVRSLRALDAIGLRRGLVAAAFLWVAFLGLPGSPWSLLLHHRLSFTATNYRPTLLPLNRVHAAHALLRVVSLI